MARREIIQRIYMFVAVCITLAVNGAVVPARATIQTPPELRDFRLDEKPPERKDPVPAGPEITTSPAPAPTPQPQPQRLDPPSVRSTVTPSPASTAVKPEQKPTAAPVRTAEKSQPRISADAAAAVENEPPAIPATTLGDAAEITTPAVIDDPVGTEPAKTGGAATHDTWSSANLPWLAIALIVGLVSALLLVWAAVKRRRRIQTEDEDMAAAVPVTAPEQPQVADTAHVTVSRPPVAALPIATKRAAKQKVEPAAQDHPELTLSFIPNKATISFTTLTIKGDLRIINEGKAEAHGMRLRAALISASEQHIDIIDGFHASADGGEGEDIGGAKPGERIGMEIELMMPLAELKTYPFKDWQLFVPIFLGNMTYGSPHDDTVRQARINCMIGREATPPAPKMGPFRLDLGPRSFAVLGQRPIAA